MKPWSTLPPYGPVRIGAVFVTPSVQTKRGQREGIPVVLMEACASGLPVVASRISGIPELIEDGVTGLLVPPGEPVAIAAAIRRIHDDPDSGRAIGAAGRARVVRDFAAFANAERLASSFTAPVTAPRVPDRPAEHLSVPGERE
jgi:colanic acid/amylovoran biosynthesis glycosyltransferase